jgi:hypothetical protein
LKVSHLQLILGIAMIHFAALGEVPRFREVEQAQL